MAQHGRGVGHMHYVLHLIFGGSHGLVGGHDAGVEIAPATESHHHAAADGEVSAHVLGHMVGECALNRHRQRHFDIFGREHVYGCRNTSRRLVFLSIMNLIMRRPRLAMRRWHGGRVRRNLRRWSLRRREACAIGAEPDRRCRRSRSAWCLSPRPLPTL